MQNKFIYSVLCSWAVINLRRYLLNIVGICIFFQILQELSNGN